MKFIMECFFFLCVAFLGVLGGIQIAQNDTVQTKEVEVQQTTKTSNQEATSTDTGNQEATNADTSNQEAVSTDTSNEVQTNVDISEVEKQLEELKSSNALSKIGEDFTTVIEKTVETVVEPMISKLNQVIK